MSSVYLFPCLSRHVKGKEKASEASSFNIVLASRCCIPVGTCPGRLITHNRDAIKPHGFDDIKSRTRGTEYLHQLLYCRPQSSRRQSVQCSLLVQPFVGGASWRVANERHQTGKSRPGSQPPRNMDACSAERRQSASFLFSLALPSSYVTRNQHHFHELTC